MSEPKRPNPYKRPDGYLMEPLIGEWLETNGPVTFDKLRSWARMSEEVFRCYTTDQLVELAECYIADQIEKAKTEKD